jgi:ABC-type cobalt transport system substrate-binding protein
MADREKEVIVTNGGGGAGAGMLVGALLVLALIAVLFFVFKDRIFGGSDINADIRIETPAAPAAPATK